MGGTFVGSQYRLEVRDKECLISVLPYHRRLKYQAAVELKIGKFIPEHAGKMQLYLASLDDRARLGEENPSVCIRGVQV